MKVYITKYALTLGIIIREDAEECKTSPSMIRVPSENICYSDAYYHGEGREWCRTEDEALKRFEELKEKKLKSLSKQIRKIEMLTPSIVRGSLNGKS